MAELKINTQRTQQLIPSHKVQFIVNKGRSKTINQNHPVRAQNSKYHQFLQNSQFKLKDNDSTQKTKNRGKRSSQSHGILQPFVNHHQAQRNSAKVQKINSHEHLPANNNENKSRNISSFMNHNMHNIINSNNAPLRSKIFSAHHPQQIEYNQFKSNPYQKFVKQLNIKLPSPQQKFKQFVQIPPFNRLKNHTDFISHILKRTLYFFRMHPSQVVDSIAKKIIQIPINQIPYNYLIVLNEGSCSYNGKSIQKGFLISRQRFQRQKFQYQGQISLIGLPSHDYIMFVTQYLNQNFNKFKKFMESIQIFKVFTETAMQKIYTSISLHFYSKGETLYEPGQSANHLYLIYEGSAARKIIVQIDKTNKIPLQKYSKLIKVLSRSYEHRIKFYKQDLVGVADIIDNILKRSQDIVIDEDATIIAIDRSAIEQNLDQYIIDRLKKYNLRKYPKNYDELCQNYLKQKIESRKAEERKIAALKDQINKDSHNSRKSEKINNIIKMYQERIKEQQKQHLIDKKKIQRIVHNES